MTGGMLCIMGHPEGWPKRIEAGPATTLVHSRIIYDIDMHGGNSGSGVLSSPAGAIVAIHTTGACGQIGGFTYGVRISALLAASPVLTNLAAGESVPASAAEER